jgi:thiamine-monophosphate kinase
MEQLQSLMLGAQDVCAEFGCGIDGGDTNSWTQGLVINVSVIGTPHPRGVVTRSGARTGDVVMVSGQTLGGSLRSGRHLTFTPRVREAQWLMDHYTIHSMMDLSDGLAADGARMAQSSATKFIFDKDAVSLDPSALYQSFCDGEDFELLFTCDPLTASHIETHAAWHCGFRRIGRVESGAGIFLEAAGQREPLPDQWQGWTHPLAVK